MTVDQSCPACGGSLEPGEIRTRGIVRFARERRPRVLFTSIVPGGRGQYFLDAVRVRAERCPACGLLVIDPHADCAHDWNDGWAFPRAKVTWAGRIRSRSLRAAGSAGARRASRCRRGDAGTVVRSR